MEKVEFLILRNLLYNEQYLRKVVPFIKSEYFEDFNQKVVFEEISSFVQEYSQVATKEVLCIEIEKRQDINDSSFKEITNLVSSLEDVPSEFQWIDSVIPLKSGVVIVPSIWHSWNLFILLMVKIKRRIVMPSHQFSLMLLQCLLTLTSVTTT